MNYYERLGVQKDATDKEIKKAYYKLALKLHPDRNKGIDTTEDMKKLNAAFETLSDPETRKTYDSSQATSSLYQSA